MGVNIPNPMEGLTERRPRRYRPPLKRYRFRPVTLRERAGLQDLIAIVERQAKMGRRTEMRVENQRNQNGFTLRWEPALQQVVVSRFRTRAWLEGHGYRW